MKYLIMLLVLSAIAGTVSAAEKPQEDRLEVYMDNAETCIHFAGEWDNTLPEDHKKEIRKAMDETCPAAKKDQELLREQYRNDPDMLAKINEFDLGQ
ncbi:hypothetical protein [Morganella psychrotolerans]|uniref:hypothetical protein n=1 Tax=Morganella psychrotolerans TaxID=368603 RepID=UPI0039B05E5E